MEVYGFPYDSKTPEAIRHRDGQLCPFAGTLCEKKRQYGFGYCSVTYAAKWDNRTPRTYAVCDHRLDGQPIKWAVQDHFGPAPARLVPEVTAVAEPKLNIDYIAYRDDPTADEGVDLIAIEAQAIDLRGGGVGPAWRAWEDGQVGEWRRYFSEEAAQKGRTDNVAYGINTGNVYKRLGTQVAVKGEYLRQVGVPLYVVTQHTILRQLRARVNFNTVDDGDAWDITFVTFDYDNNLGPDGRIVFSYREHVRTTLENYQEALTNSSGASSFLRTDLIEKVKTKARKAR